MKRSFVSICVLVTITFAFGVGSGFCEEPQKGACPKQACFEKMDADKNGQISEAEFTDGCKSRFASMDADKSGSLTKDEMKPCSQMKQGHTGCPGMKGTQK
jgi:hypothetical protein